MEGAGGIIYSLLYLVAVVLYAITCIFCLISGIGLMSNICTMARADIIGVTKIFLISGAITVGGAFIHYTLMIHSALPLLFR